MAHLASDARLLEAAEGRRGVGRAPDVHVHLAGAQQRGELVRRADVAGPDAGGEPIVRVVRALGDLLQRLVWHRDQHRAKDLLARNLHVVADAGEQRRLDEIAAGRSAVRMRVSAHHELGAVLAPPLDVSGDAPELLLRD